MAKAKFIKKIDLNALVTDGTLAVIKVPKSFDFEYFADLDGAEGMGGTDTIVLNDQLCIVCSSEIAAEVMKMVEQTIEEADEDDE